MSQLTPRVISCRFFVNFFYCFQPYKSLKPVDSMTEAEL